MLILNLSALAEGTLKRYFITIGKTVTIHPNAGEVFLSPYPFKSQSHCWHNKF
jgi:hypothetical protein